MKKFVKPGIVAVACILLAFYQPAKAAVGPHRWFSLAGKYPAADNKFTIELNRESTDDVIRVVIENPGRKNLSVTLSGPDGSLLDNFFTGRRFVKMNKQYNFSGAEEGVYTITISYGGEKIQKQVKFERVFATPVNRLIVQ